MQCGCPECGTWMTQVQKGLKSHCACAHCGYTCNACMGKEAPSIARKQINAIVKDNDSEK